jgi:Cu/Ag efflux pump CusA
LRLAKTPQTVFAHLLLRGTAQASVSKLTSMGSIPVQINLQEPYRSSADSLGLLHIPLPDGGFINLGEISHAVYRAAPRC